MKRRPISVNDLLDRAAALHGTVVAVYGLYALEFEDSTLHHLPGSERRAGWRTSIWVAYPSNVTVVGAKAPSALAGKRVVVTGRLEAIGDGFGHGGLSGAQIVARRIERLRSLP